MELKSKLEKPSKSNLCLIEHSAFFDPNPREIEPGYLNNFYTKLPGGYRRDMIWKGTKTPLRDFLENSQNLPLYTAKRLVQSEEQFFSEIDSAVIASGLSLEEITEANIEILRAMDIARGLPFIERVKGLREIFELILGLEARVIPVYLELRGRGYNHYDLVG